jgi:integrase
MTPDGKKSAFQKTTLRSTLIALRAAQPQSIYLRDGELVVYRRSRSLFYQCRYRLADGSWLRQTTGFLKAGFFPVQVLC